MAETNTDLQATAELSSAVDDLTLRTRDLQQAANRFGRTMTDAFARSITDGRRFEDTLKSLALRMSDISLRLALKPLERSLSSGIAGLLGGAFGVSAPLSAGDTAMLKDLGDIKPFADGGVIASPHYFPLAAGQLGLAGEAGPEAILPLSRGADGKLGVAASGGEGAPAPVTVHINTPDAASFRRSEAYVSGLIARAVARGQRSL